MEEKNKKILESLENGGSIVVPKNIALWISGISPITVVIMIFYLGSFTKDLESRTFDDAEQKIEVIHHIERKDIHYNYERNSDVFVPRTEVEYRLKSIETKLERIADKLNVN